VINDRSPNTPRNSLPGSRLIDFDVNMSHDFALSTPYLGIITSPFFGQANFAQPPAECNVTSNSNSEAAKAYTPITVAALPPAR
jgi:hypothetical protein